jgi:hypothetical protein
LGIFAIGLQSVASAAGFAFNENFIVFTPHQRTREAEQRFAELVLKRAMAFRQEFAKEWLGEPLAEGEGRSVIHIDFSAHEDRGLTWAKDHPGRTLHNVFLRTSPENATGSTLQHEIAHTVLASRFPHPNRLPAWLEEGIASRYDDESRHAQREDLLYAWVRSSGSAPNLVKLMATPDIKSFDETSYAAATSLVRFLLTRGDEHKILKFGVDGQQNGWDDALRSHYDIYSVRDLQQQWQNWLERQRR